MSGEYMRRLLLAIQKGIIPKKAVAMSQVLHDSWCGIHESKPCNCDPDITLHLPSGEVMSVTKNGLLEKVTKQ